MAIEFGMVFNFAVSFHQRISFSAKYRQINRRLDWHVNRQGASGSSYLKSAQYQWRTDAPFAISNSAPEKIKNPRNIV